MDPLGFGSAVLSATEGPLKISPLFPNGLTPCSRREGRRHERKREREWDSEVERERQRWPFKMIALFPKGLASVQGEFFREQTVECVLSNEATVQLSQSLFSALLVRSGHWEHMFSLYYLSLSPLIVYLSPSPSPSIFLFFLSFFFWLPICCFCHFFSGFPRVSCNHTIKPGRYWNCEWQVAVTCWVTLPAIQSELQQHWPRWANVGSTT